MATRPQADVPNGPEGSKPVLAIPQFEVENNSVATLGCPVRLPPRRIGDVVMPHEIILQPVGFVRGGRAEATDDEWGGNRADIELEPAFSAEALLGLSEFSHLEVIFFFDRVPQAKIETGARHPRGRADWPRVGIFAQRGKNRPNRLGLCTCKIVGVSGTTISVQGLDAIDGTPVLDLKPVMQEFLPREPVKQPEWSTEIMSAYW